MTIIPKEQTRQRRRAKLVLSSGSSNAVIATADAKTHLRVDHSDDDDYIDGLIVAATRIAENYTSKSFLTATWQYWIDAGHRLLRNDTIELPRTPLQASSVSITSYDNDDTDSTFATGNYRVLTNSGRVGLVEGASWPSALRDEDSVVIQFDAGFGDTIAAVDDHWEKMIVAGVQSILAFLYENRGDYPADFMKIPGAWKTILAPLKPRRL